MPELKGSKTEQNLWTAFAGESQARNKYTYFASKAKKDGYVQISKIFEETAANEKEHAEIWFKLLGGIGTTAENLEGARGPLPQAALQCGGRPGVLPGRRHDLAVQQLRPHPRGQAGPRGLPRVRPSPRLLPAEGGKLLIESIRSQKTAAGALI